MMTLTKEIFDLLESMWDVEDSEDYLRRRGWKRQGNRFVNPNKPGFEASVRNDGVMLHSPNGTVTSYGHHDFQLHAPI